MYYKIYCIIYCIIYYILYYTIYYSCETQHALCALLLLKHIYMFAPCVNRAPLTILARRHLALESFAVAKHKGSARLINLFVFTARRLTANNPL